MVPDMDISTSRMKKYSIRPVSYTHLDSVKITNIAILENKDKGELFVSMPRYRSNERDESNGVIYKDCLLFTSRCV